MNYISQIVKNILENNKMSTKMQLQLNKVCEFESSFVKEFSKEKLQEYFNLDIEKGKLHIIEIDLIISITYKVCKELFKN